MFCPRCGAFMEDGICNECGFPVTMVFIDKPSGSFGKQKSHRLIQIENKL